MPVTTSIYKWWRKVSYLCRGKRTSSRFYRAFPIPARLGASLRKRTFLGSAVVSRLPWELVKKKWNRTEKKGRECFHVRVTDVVSTVVFIVRKVSF
ncbi:hypothetical protein TNCT_234121 [Trichonephila clavata]|uniref:Uncharacterized protein n=1 Tax=Trichonephila clavata TaxID=2740835 RepID=A0A8X6KY48_TRICU|nr:hypothetical protein TNCT_234121 [Trichonephila clavata]